MTTSAEAKIEITAGTSRLPAGLRTALKSFQGFVTSVGQSLIGINSSREADKAGAKAWGQHALGQVAGNLATRGLDLLVDQGKQVIDFERELTRLGIDLRKRPDEMRSIGLAMRSIANESGIGAEKVLSAGRAYADLAGAEAFTVDKMRLIARAAQASGSDVGDMASLMFTLTENMKVPPNELEDTISGLINQAKDGSIHFKELAHELVALGAVYPQFGVTGREGAIQVGAQLQISRRGFASASEAATGILRIYRSLPQHASKFRKAGVDVFADGSKNTLRPFEDIIRQIQGSPLALNREALIKSFGRTEGERFYQVLTLMVEQYDKLKDAGRANGVVTKDLATFVESAAGRMDVAFERTKNKIAEAFTPERIEKFSHALEDIAAKIEPIAKLVGFTGDVLGGLYGAGKAVRGFITPGDSRLYAPTSEEIEKYTAEGVPEPEARTMLKGRHDRYAAAKIAIAAAMKDDRTTPESDELAVRARFDQRDKSGEGAQSAGAAYIEAAGLSPEQVDEISKKVREKDIDAEISAGRGRSVATGRSQLDVFNDAIEQRNAALMVAAFKEAITTTLGPAIGKAISGSRAPIVQLDGSKVSDGIGNAQSSRRR